MGDKFKGGPRKKAADNDIPRPVYISLCWTQRTTGPTIAVLTVRRAGGSNLASFTFCEEKTVPILQQRSPHATVAA